MSYPICFEAAPHVSKRVDNIFLNILYNGKNTYHHNYNPCCVLEFICYNGKCTKCRGDTPLPIITINCIIYLLLSLVLLLLLLRLAAARRLSWLLHKKSGIPKH